MSSLPSRLLRRLAQLRRRSRRLLAVDGVARLVTLTLLLTAAVIAADWLLRFPGTVRLLLLAGLVATLAVETWRVLVAPLRAALSDRELALRLERAFPGFGQRLSTAVALREQPPATGTARRLAETVQSEAEFLAERNDFNALIRLGPAVRSLLLSAVAVTAVVAGWNADAESVEIGLTRLLAPLSEVRWPTRVEIDPGSLPGSAHRVRRVPVGRTVTLELRLRRGDRESLTVRAWVSRDSLSDPDAAADPNDLRAWLPMEMARVRPGEPTFRLALPVTRSQVYRFEAGDAASPSFALVAVPRPTDPVAVDVGVLTEPPEYLPTSDVDGRVRDLRQGSVTVLAGSRVRLRVRPDQPDALIGPVARLRLGEGSSARTTTQPLSWTRSSDGQRVLSAEWTATADAAVSVDLVAGRSAAERARIAELPSDEQPVPAPLEEFAVRTLPDLAPRVRIDSPEGLETLVLATAAVPMRLLAEDDNGFADSYGIGGVRLRGQVVVGEAREPRGASDRSARPVRVDAVAAAGESARTVRTAPDRVELSLAWGWELAELKLLPGEVVEFTAEVRDAAWTVGSDGRRVPLRAEWAAAETRTAPDGSRQPLYRRLRVVTAAELLAGLRREFLEIAAALDRVVGEQRRLGRRLEPIRAAVDGPKATGLSDADRTQLAELELAEAELAHRLESARTAVESVHSRMVWNRLDDARGRALSRLAADELARLSRDSVPAIGVRLRTAREAAPRDRASPREQATLARTLDEAAGQQLLVARRLSVLIAQMREWSGLSALQGRLSEIADGQRQISDDTARRASDPATAGKSPEQLTDDQRRANAELAERQQALAGELERWLAELDRFSREAQREDAEAAAQAGETAEAARTERLGDQMRQAAESLSGNRAGSAGDTQRAVREALGRLAEKLAGRADERSLDQLSKKTAELLEAVRQIIARQEAHNAAARARLGLPAKPGDDKPGDAKPGDAKPAPTAARIAADQDHTRAETDGLAERIRALPDSGDPDETADAVEAETQLGRAAVRMRRAVVGLSADPIDSQATPEEQTRALDHLRQAERVLARMAERQRRRRVDQQIAQLSAEIARLRENQHGLRQQNAELTTRLAGKTVGRRELVQVAAMARRQTELRAEADALRGRLGNSIVFGWTLEQVAARMRTAAESLGNRQIGPPSLGPQAAAVAMLDRLLESLKLENRERLLDAHSGGAGGMGGGSSGNRNVPPIAELKMLRALQLDLNDRLARLDERLAEQTTLSVEDARGVRELADLSEQIRRMAVEMTVELRRQQER